MTWASGLMYQWSQMRVTVASAAPVAPFSGGHQDQGTGGAARKDRLRMRRGKPWHSMSACGDYGSDRRRRPVRVFRVHLV
jgi:hypothetical protein